MVDGGSGPTAAEQDRSLDLGAMLRQLWNHRLSGLVALALALAAAIIYLHVATYKYTATIVVVPADQSGNKAGGSLAGLGSLVGINLSGDQGTAFAYYGEAIKSQAVARRLADDRRIMTTVFADEWDASAQKWVDRPSTVKGLKSAVKSALGVPRRQWAPPSADDLRIFLEENITIIEDREKAKLTISFASADKAFAAYLLNAAFRQTDEFLRANSLSRTSAYAEYLEQRLRQATVAEYRQSLAETLATYEKTRMMASSNVSFAGERFGDVWVSRNPTQPAPFLVLFVATALAVILWAAAVLLFIPVVGMMRR